MAAFRWSCVLVVSAVLCGAAHAQRSQAAVRAAPQAAPGQSATGHAPEMRIAAVVNDDVISVFDLVSRMQMVMLSSNIPDTPELRERMGRQVLRSLIDEKLQLQEAKRQNVTVPDSDVEKALQKIAQQNNMSTEQLTALLKSRGIGRSALVDQVKATLVWTKLVRRQAAQTVDISDEEIDEAVKRARENAKEAQSRIGEIFLTVDSPTQDEEVRRFAERLSQEMRRGARFSAVARQFSQAASAPVGGDMGWLRPDQLPPELAKAVAQLGPGDLSAPIPYGGGYYLLLVLDRRLGGASASKQETIYDMVQVVFPLPPRAAEAALRAAVGEAENLRGAATDCPTLLKIGREKAPQLTSEGKIPESRISPEMRSVIDGLPTGQVSQPIVQKNGVGVIMVCGKATAGGENTREEIAESLIRQRLDTVSRRYLRDLRRNSYVDVRV
ncbi:MAG: peptidylprolyl isomerase [Alphaproteobacteria bacterium]